MSKYIIKESALRSDIKKVVSEELSRILNESIGHALGSALLNTGKIAAMGALAPGLLAQKSVVKANDILGGDSTVAGSVGEFFGMNDGARGGNKFTKNNGNKTPADRQKEIRQNSALVKREYGEPETEAGLGKRLTRKRNMVVSDFLGSGENVDFGRHYFERGQSSESSVWSKKLAKAKSDIENLGDPSKVGKYRKQYYKTFKKWLEERDEAYEEYIKTIR